MPQSLYEKLDQLLTYGEPLLAAFPTLTPGHTLPHLPDNISDEMRLFAHHVAYRTQNPQSYSRDEPAPILRARITTCEAGLLGWRAIGVLQ